jgi:PAS domain S-box-containing protein
LSAPAERNVPRPAGRLLYAIRKKWYYVRMIDPQTFQRAFGRRLDSPWHLSLLFDYLPDTYFYAKNNAGQFILVNQALADMHGACSPAAMIGKTDYDFSPHDLADQYVAEDRRVIERGRPLANQAWLVRDHRGQLKWYLSSKIPLFGDGGAVIGIAGAMRDIEKAGTFLKPYHEMEQVVAHVFERYPGKVEVPALARLAHLSLSQFDRRFKHLFHMTPQQFLLRVRVHAACRLLATTPVAVAQIAARSGFYDQSYFTKQFRRNTGLTPAAYRRKYRTGEPPAMENY